MTRLLSLTLWMAAAIATVAAAGCSRTNRLAEYDFRGATLALHTAIPSRPDVFTSDVFFYERGRPWRFLFKVGSSLIKEAEAEKARVRMDSANQCIDVAGILHERTLEQAARYLDALPVDEADAPDYLLDVVVTHYGIDAEAWDAHAYFTLEAEALLIDRASGRLVWETKFEEREALSPVIFGPHAGMRNIMTAGALARLSVEEMTVALEQLAVFSADRITRHLRRDLFEARG